MIGWDNRCQAASHHLHEITTNPVRLAIIRLAHQSLPAAATFYLTAPKEPADFGDFESHPPLLTLSSSKSPGKTHCSYTKLLRRQNSYSYPGYHPLRTSAAVPCDAFPTKCSFDVFGCAKSPSFRDLIQLRLRFSLAHFSSSAVFCSNCQSSNN